MDMSRGGIAGSSIGATYGGFLSHAAAGSNREWSTKQGCQGCTGLRARNHRLLSRALPDLSQQAEDRHGRDIFLMDSSVLKHKSGKLLKSRCVSKHQAAWAAAVFWDVLKPCRPERWRCPTDPLRGA